MNIRQAKKLLFNDEIKIKNTNKIVKVIACEIDETFKPTIIVIHADNDESYYHTEIC